MKRLILLSLAGFVLTACGNDVGESLNQQTEGAPTNTETHVDDESVNEESSTEEQKTEKASVATEEIDPLHDFSNKRKAAYDAAKNFLEVVLNDDTKDAADYTIRGERREKLEPYVSAEILMEFEPTDEELTEQGLPIPADDIPYDSTVSAVTNLMEFEYILGESIIFIDEESIHSDTIEVIADGFYTYITDMEGFVEENEHIQVYKFYLELEGEAWVISEYELLEGGRLLPEDQRQDYTDFYS